MTVLDMVHLAESIEQGAWGMGQKVWSQGVSRNGILITIPS